MLMQYPKTQHQVSPAQTFGATLHEDGVAISVYSRSASEMRLLLYDHVNDFDPVESISFNADGGRTGNVWTTFVRGIGAGQLYHLQVEGPSNLERGLLFNGKARLIDPYAKALAGDFQHHTDGITRPPKCVVVDDADFDWEDVARPRHSLAESIIYELHVRGFTQHDSSQVNHRGSYLGLIEKIPYLVSLGITAVELMPVHEFPILGPDGHLPMRTNYWGYDPMAFFSPHRGYAANAEPGAQVREFKQLVKALHGAGIEVILDVVFNHTCEGNEKGPVLSFKGLENQVYYLTHNGRYYKNYSGCGNTLNCNHPVVADMIIDCLRHWAVNYHIDGFRFDLASILNRDRHGNLLQPSPLVDRIAEDPVLADCKLIAEAWDAAGAYQVGHFAGRRWAEWNGRYRDDVRRFWRGDGGMLGPIATRLAGSSDMYEYNGRHPFCSVNFITSHDGFTMNDLVSYRHKHNHANGEHNGDGDNNNLSENYGVEGPTNDPNIEDLRLRQIKNMMATVLLSQGVPMLVAGDEFRRTQQGNNNAYCQDNETSWIDWERAGDHRELVRFVRSLIRFRREQPSVRREKFLTGQPDGHPEHPDVSWFAANGNEIYDWHSHDMTLTALLTAPPLEQDPEHIGRAILMMMNGTHSAREFVFPVPSRGDNWRLFINTASRAPHDVFPNFNGPEPPKSGRLILKGRSMMCYVATS